MHNSSTYDLSLRYMNDNIQLITGGKQNVYAEKNSKLQAGVVAM